jgi:putative component of membrane protein insertase Oxa1/YidC/SpoIIIJ protein YidD
MYLPTEWERDVAYIYVNYRRIVRPDTSYKKAVIYVLLFVSAAGVFTWLAHFVLVTVGLLTYLPPVFGEFYGFYPVLSVVFLCAAVVLVLLLFCFKHAVIGAVRLYQHYAPEEIRRRCNFKPTCSEYTIIAVRKYGGIIGLIKGWYRLVYLCKGSIYLIHYPWEKARY